VTDMNRSFVIGGAGFIGSHLVDRLVQSGSVTIYDNLSIGKSEFIQSALDSGKASLIEADVLDLETLLRAMKGHQRVYHLAANPEARWGLENPRLDLEQGTIATWNVLEAMRRSKVPELVFASSGTVYGDTSNVCSEGDLGELPISLYGASKLAGEALVAAFVECFGIRAWIFRFGNVVGPRGTHGAALDFFKKLRATRGVELEVLGDGSQAKPYVHVTDCVDGILFVTEHADATLGVFNIAPSDSTSVRHIAEQCVRVSPFPNASVRYTGGDRGWPGDVPQSRLDGSRLAQLGWRPKNTSQQAIDRAIEELAREVFAP